MARVTFQPLDRTVQVASGATVLKAAQSASIDLPWVCGGNRICTTCRCLVESDAAALSPPDEQELEIMEIVQLVGRWRLGCQARVLRDVTIRIPPDLTVPSDETRS